MSEKTRRAGSARTMARNIALSLGLLAGGFTASACSSPAAIEVSSDVAKRPNLDSKIPDALALFGPSKPDGTDTTAVGVFDNNGVRKLVIVTSGPRKTVAIKIPSKEHFGSISIGEEISKTLTTDPSDPASGISFTSVTFEHASLNTSYYDYENKHWGQHLDRPTTTISVKPVTQAGHPDTPASEVTFVQIESDGHAFVSPRQGGVQGKPEYKDLNDALKATDWTSKGKLVEAMQLSPANPAPTAPVGLLVLPGALLAARSSPGANRPVATKAGK